MQLFAWPRFSSQLKQKLFLAYSLILHKIFNKPEVQVAKEILRFYIEIQVKTKKISFYLVSYLDCSLEKKFLFKNFTNVAYIFSQV